LPEEQVDLEGEVTRMDAAFGSGDGDEEATAVVAKSKASLGQIFEQTYRPWDGELGPR
jgi:hypothetical protein